MGKPNCWDLKRCGRESGGPREGEQGVCPAALDVASDGLNGGRNGGRICWAIAGTLCDAAATGTFASKIVTCTRCEVFKQVQHDEGRAFTLCAQGQGPSHTMIEQFASIMSIIDSINAAVYVADLSTYELLYINPYTEKLFGPCVGKPCYEVLQKGQRGPCAFCTNARLVENGEATAGVAWEFQNTVTGRWFSCIDRAIPWWDGRLVRMEIAFDITERKKAEEFRDQYVGLISHDLRNPLNTVMLRAETVQRALRHKGLVDEAAAIACIVSSARHMNDLIEDLVETSRRESGCLQPDTSDLELGEMLRRGVARLASPDERARVELLPASEPLTVLADATQLARVIDNLLSNALKFSSATVKVTVRRDGAEARFSVSDRGVGMAAADLAKLFQRFFRASTAGSVKGIGLGLYNARMIVEAHGGRIWAESEPDRGTTFHIALPLAPA